LVSEKVTLKKTIKNIYSELTRKKTKLNYKLQDKIEWTVIAENVPLKKFTKMYNGYNYRYKYRFLKPLMFFVLYIFTKSSKLVLGESLIEDKNLSKDNHNRVITAWNKSIDETCKDSMLIFKKDIKLYENPYSKYWTKFIKTVNNIFMQNIYYDTYYRSMFEMFVIKLTKNINESYKDDNVHIFYTNKSLNDIDYYVATQRNNGQFIVIQDSPESILVIPKGQALKLDKQNIKKIYDSLLKGEKNV